MGDKFRTIQNLEIIKSDIENNLIFIKGSVPGTKNSMVLIQKKAKQINKKTTAEKMKLFQTETASSATSGKSATKKAPAATKVVKKEEKKK